MLKIPSLVLAAAERSAASLPTTEVPQQFSMCLGWCFSVQKFKHVALLYTRFDVNSRLGIRTKKSDTHMRERLLKLSSVGSFMNKQTLTYANAIDL